MSIAESGPQLWRLVRQGVTREMAGTKEEIVFKNPGKVDIVWFRGQAYVIKEGTLMLAPDEVLAKLRELELKRG